MSNKHANYSRQEIYCTTLDAHFTKQIVSKLALLENKYIEPVKWWKETDNLTNKIERK